MKKKHEEATKAGVPAPVSVYATKYAPRPSTTAPTRPKKIIAPVASRGTVLSGHVCAAAPVCLLV
jgi:hypothetical protein